MGWVRKFKCDMCGCMEETERNDKPEHWEFVRPKNLSPVIASKKQPQLLVCAGCHSVFETLAASVRELAEKYRQRLTAADVISIASRKAWDVETAIDPEMAEDVVGEDEDEDDEDEDDQVTPRKKKRPAAFRRPPGGGDGG